MDAVIPPYDPNLTSEENGEMERLAAEAFIESEEHYPTSGQHLGLM